MIQNKKNIDATDQIISFIDLSVELLVRFLDECDRLLVEIPNEVKDFHIDILNQMIELSKFRKDACVDFKREHIIKHLRDESMRSLLDDIYGKTRDGFEGYMALGSVSPRLKTYIGTKLIQKSEKRTKSVVAKIEPFPTPQGSKWDEVEIGLLTEGYLRVTVKDTTMIIHYSKMGLQHKQSKTQKPLKMWHVLRFLAICNGCFGYDETENPRVRVVEKVSQDDIPRLNKVLKNYFGIPGTPIIWEKYKNKYSALFQIFCVRDDNNDDD